MFKIIGVKHDSNGEIISYKLDNNKIIDKKEAVKFAEEGKIDGVIIGVSKNGEKFLKNMPDGNKFNNLDNMQEI
ncbi:hypothetical protein Q428_13860 [Fervidicella metallireducens AeB]|uniref:DUF3892 domain-containing protein n=1 Tax=Fervidicella metallireducens AeB TaxID=1403537 RepID=A0A017RS93_9CLOT|nr:DUF3892 domain-containing protein [Fervidicella metallireducens]EYE87339.1 hypothetical protein Q428_13860 [Fervidicella metallireducens AeB]